MIRRPPRSTLDRSSAASDVYKRQVYWWYHVAPLVTVRDHHQLKKFVMDPSMFDEPVSIETWTGAQENLDCSPYADFGYSDITPGYIYAPGGSTDNFYASTNWTLQWYADLVTCD